MGWGPRGGGERPELAGALETQRVAPLFRGSMSLPTLSVVDSGATHRTHWIVGGLLGAAVVGGGSAGTAQGGFCDERPRGGWAILLGGIGGGVGFLLWVLILCQIFHDAVSVRTAATYEPPRR